ncbi:MAG: T9SS C-terminal target domain-containing protein, partial [Chitinophagia bacterium]|nr:T9SS C-terminal target domain-containing protein [Chitinophagia bacterium]
LHGRVTFVGTPDTGRAIITGGATTGSDSVYYVERSTAGCGSDTAWFAVSNLVAGGSITITDSARFHNNLCTGISYTYRSSFSGGTWSSSDTSIGTINASTGVVNPVRVGTFMITYSITSAACGTYFDTLSITVHPIDAGFITGPSVVCVGGSDTLTDTVRFGTWYSLNPSIFTITSAGIVTGVANGTDSAVYVISSSACGANDTAFHSITVTSTAHNTITASATSLCEGNPLSDTTSVFSSGIGGVWSSSDTSIATVSATGHVAANHRTGTVTIRYTVTATCGTVYDSVNIAVDSVPTAGHIIGDTVCVGSTLALRDSAGTTGGTWSTSDATIASVNATTGVVRGVRAGSVTIQYLVVTGCGSDSVRKTIIVDTAVVPVAITGADSICAGGTTTFVETTTGGSWSTSDATVASVDGSGNVTAVGATATFRTANITYTITGRCGTTSASRAVHIKPNGDTASFSVPAVLCDTDVITLSPSIAGGIWSSSVPTVATVDTVSGVVTGRRGSVTGSNTVISYSIASAYGCAAGVTTRTLIVYSKPTATITPATPVLCVGSTVTFTGNTPIGATGAWATGTHTAISQSIAVNRDTVRGVAVGTDSVTYILTSNVGCGSGIAKQVISVDSTPFAGTITGPGAVCFDSVSSVLSYTITGASNYTSGAWSTGTSDLTVIAFTDSTADVVATGAGNIDVIRIVNARCGSDTARLTVASEFNPDAGIDSTYAAICPGTSDTITTYTRRGVSFATHWYSSDTSIVTVTTGSINAVVTATTPGTSTIMTAYIYAVDSNQCGTDTAVFTFRVNPSIPNPGVITSVGSSVCVGTLATLSDTVTGGRWISSNSGIATVNSSGVVTAVAPGTVTFDYIVTNICGSDTASITLKVSNAPKLVVPTVAPVCDSTLLTVNLTADSTTATFHWTRPAVTGVANVTDTGNGNIREYLDDTTGANVVVKYVVVSSVNGCSSSDSFNVTVKPTPYFAGKLADTVCSGSGAYITFAATTAGTTANWSRPDVTNITPAGPVTGTGNIAELLVNATNLPIIVPYTYLMVAAGCSNTAVVNLTVNPTPTAPKIVTHPAPNLCKSTDYMNFGAATTPPSGQNYFWTADNAQVWATGRTKQYSLVTYGQSGTATVFLNAVYAGYSCPARDSFIVNVSEKENDSPRVIYWNGDFILLANDRDTYQWGYDDASTLDSTILTGQTNQNYTNVTPDFTSKWYWCISTKNGCMQKSYLTVPTAVQNVTGVIGDMKLYPNPAEQFVNVEINSAASGEFSVELVDMSGRHIGSYNANDRKVTIGIGDIASGMYFVECYHNGVKFATTKFVKN